MLHPKLPSRARLLLLTTFPSLSLTRQPTCMSSALTGRRLVIMEARRINAFADENLDDRLKLATVRA
jgi:hypothetical protein